MKKGKIKQYPCCDFLNSALRLISMGKTDVAIQEIQYAIRSIDGYITDDVFEWLVNNHKSVVKNKDR